VFDTSDPDWILVGFDGEYGFAPANYIELSDDTSSTTTRPAAAAESRRKMSIESNEGQSEPTQSPVHSPAAAIAGIISQRQVSSLPTSRPAVALPPRPQYTPEVSDEEEQTTPSLPARPQSQSISPPSNNYPTPRSPDSLGIAASPPHNRAIKRSTDEDATNYNSGSFHLYNINEMVSVMGKRKKMPTTLGINLATGTIMIAPEKARDGPQQEWTAEKMTHYSIEGKHVFLELVRPSKSVDFHAGAKDTAEEIVAALGDMAGAVKAEGLREVILAGSGQGQKKGIVLYDFMAQGDDEVSVAVDDEVIIIDDTKSEEWWQVRRIKNGKEGVVPSSYVEVSGTMANPSLAGINAGRSTVEQNRLEEQRLARDALKDPKSSEVGPGMRLPERGSSLSARDSGTSSQRNKSDNKTSSNGQPRSSRSSE
jgi:actin cytoskeleton-regulatory complex protein SLA1